MSKVKHLFHKGFTAVSEQSGLLLEISRLKSRITPLEDRNEALREELGQQIYRLWKEKAPLEATVEKFCAQMAANDREIQRLSREIDKLRRPEKPKEPQPQGIVCVCGALNRPHARFCARCGARLGELPTEEEPGAPQSEQDAATLP